MQTSLRQGRIKGGTSGKFTTSRERSWSTALDLGACGAVERGAFAFLRASCGALAPGTDRAALMEPSRAAASGVTTCVNPDSTTDREALNSDFPLCASVSSSTEREEVTASAGLNAVEQGKT